MKKKPLSARLLKAEDDLNLALGVFENVANQLDAATAAHEAIVEEADAEIAALQLVRSEAQNHINRSQTAAQRVRELLG